MTEVSVWKQCYADSWHGLLLGPAYAHPAKFAKGLIFRIAKHLLAEGFARPGDTILDPFGGVALGSLPSNLYGLHWIGCELEPRFVQLGLDNIEAWKQRYNHVPGYGTSTLLQGDSRRLAEVLREQVTGVVSSPPYAASLHPNESREQQLARLSTKGKRLSQLSQSTGGNCGYGDSDPAQLGNLPAGTVEAAIDGVISSPPWEDQLVNHDSKEAYEALHAKMYRDGKAHGGTVGASLGTDYGTSSGQLGTEHGTTFWEAAATIIAQVGALLKPNGIAVWVVKSYVRDSQIVDFPGQWRTLCESLGLVTLHEHHAMLVEDHGTQHDLLEPDKPDRKPTSTPDDLLKPLVSTSTYAVHNQAKRRQTKRVSFFRRLHEKRRPDLAIEYEVVLCMQKRGGGTEDGLDACVSSPPWENQLVNHDSPEAYQALKDKIYRDGKGHGGSVGASVGHSYGATEGQLGSMPPGSLDACVSSPPYAESLNAATNGIDWSKTHHGSVLKKHGHTPHSSHATGQMIYGHTEGQLGAMPAGPPP